MLNARPYIEAINDAAFSGNTVRFKAVLAYCSRFGLALDTLDKNNMIGFTLVRAGNEPYSLNITIDGRNGWAYLTPFQRHVNYFHNENGFCACDDWGEDERTIGRKRGKKKAKTIPGTIEYRPGVDEIKKDKHAIAFFNTLWAGMMLEQALEYFSFLRSEEAGFPLHLAVSMVSVRMLRIMIKETDGVETEQGVKSDI